MSGFVVQGVNWTCSINKVVDGVFDDISAWLLLGYRHLELVSLISVTVAGCDLMPV